MLITFFCVFDQVEITITHIVMTNKIIIPKIPHFLYCAIRQAVVIWTQLQTTNNWRTVMNNKLELLYTGQLWVAVFSGETGEGEIVREEEAYNITGDSDDERVSNALLVWGADEENTDVTITD
jgi:hypothetical protein